MDSHQQELADLGPVCERQEGKKASSSVPMGGVWGVRVFGLCLELYLGCTWGLSFMLLGESEAGGSRSGALLVELSRLGGELRACASLWFRDVDVMRLR